MKLHFSLHVMDNELFVQERKLVSHVEFFHSDDHKYLD